MSQMIGVFQLVEMLLLIVDIVLHLEVMLEQVYQVLHQEDKMRLQSVINQLQIHKELSQLVLMRMH